MTTSEILSELPKLAPQDRRTVMMRKIGHMGLQMQYNLRKVPSELTAELVGEFKNDDQ